ncbi:DUF5704 domain-containing protein [Paenibacillus puldeungensis]|uniref:DUF5704 domain-containing protein n=1 Tax=Paenibacillus puldeungensis TaxID=696536 RepID=UPI0036D3AE10
MQWTKSEQEENTYYSVGMGYADVWTNSAGIYIEDPYTGEKLEIGSTMAEAHYDWEYQMIYSGRKIKSIIATKFNQPIVPGESSEWVNKMFKYARYGATWSQLQSTFANVNSVAIKGKRGLGTDTATITINESFTLDGERPEELDTTGLSDGVRGYRFYFPILFKAELEPLEGQAIIKHFTTTGQSLDGIESFTDRTEKLVNDRPYSYTHTPGTMNYEYKGYQKSTQKEPVGGPNATGDPPGFTYNGDFPIYYVYFYYDKKGGPPDTPTSGCTRPTPSGNVIDVPLNDPGVSAVIKADSRGGERFNVLDGIPTSESLYGNVLAKSYLHQNKFVEMSGKCTYNITVNRTYTLTWDPGKTEIGPDKKPRTVPDPQTDTETVTKSYPVERDYSFWVIDNLEVYQINEAALQNYAFEGNGIRIQPNGYTPPSYATAKSGGFTPPSPSTTVEAPPGSKSGGKERPDVSGENLESFAQDEVKKVKVKNDTLTFNGGTTMSGAETEEKGPRPGQIPVASQIGQNVLYSPGNVIPLSKTNKANQTSSGTIYYGVMSGSINGGADKSFPIYGINSVTVHTPVVIYPSVSDDQAHNQKTKPAAGRSAIILDRPFTVEMPNSGQHTNYLGYGNRNYLKYIGSKQVRFPFDVYDGSKTTFYPKNTWIEVDKSKESFTFFLPVWVDEGFYNVEFRTIAHNAPAGATQQTNANLDLTHHIAYDTVSVDAIGRVYDFRITDIADYNWESVFRVKPGSSVPIGTSYWVGQNGIDGAVRGNAARYTLPIRPGSHPLYKNAVIKTGYHFKFDLKTKGNMFGPQDQIVITPAFDFISASTGKRVAVDLYYNTGSSKFVKIGSAADKVQRYVILNERLRNVPTEELTDTALYKYDHEYTFNQVAGIGRGQFVQNFIQKWSKQKTSVGSFSRLRLPEGVRTLIGPKEGIPSGVDQARVNAAEQKWYGEYSLPSDLYAVAAGTNVAEYGRTHGGLTDKSPVFLKNGYIVVNFNIETVRNGEISSPYLQYIHGPLMNQWHGMEGFARTVRDPYGRTFSLRDGDVVFYHADKSSRGDFRSMVTH